MYQKAKRVHQKNLYQEEFNNIMENPQPPLSPPSPIDEEILDCPYCNNDGYIIITVNGSEAGCCGNISLSGECCGNPVQVLVPELGQEQCQFCHENKNSRFNFNQQPPYSSTKFPRLINGECDGLGCNFKICWCNEYLDSREKYQEVFNKPWDRSTDECNAWEESFRYSFLRYKDR